MLSQVFNKIYVIQSLRPNDRKTGTNLYNEISIRVQTENLPVKAEIIDLETLGQLLNAFEKILNQVQYNQVFPVIHIETHGDSKGLELRSGELVGANIIDLLVKINIACKNNLLLTIAACNGVFIVDRIIEKLDKLRAPFWMLIAPKDNMFSSDLESAFISFYDDLLRKLNFDLAITKLDDRYEFYYCTHLFTEGFKLYKSKLDTATNRQERADKLLTRLRQLPQYKDVQLGEIRHLIKYELRNSEENFKIAKSYFFMIDLYPENEDRFNVNYDELVDV